MNLEIILNKFLELSEKEMNVAEAKDHHNPRIIEYDSTTTLKAKDDTIPWCSSFVNWIVTQTQKELSIDLKPTNSASARSWMQWGERALSPFKPGSILVMRRGENPVFGHVGFLLNVDKKGFFRIRSGNTGSKVAEMMVPPFKVLDGGIRVPEV